MNQQQIQAVRAIAGAIVESVKEMGEGGAPSGPMYAAFMGKLTLEQYQQIMDTLVRAGRLRQEGHVYYFVKDL